MDPRAAFCPNEDCLARGHTQRGTIKIHDRRRQRYRCTPCGRTFSACTGTGFHQAHTPPEAMTLVLTLLTYGCPLVAIEAAFGFQRRTVRPWLPKARDHCQAVHEHLGLKPKCLQHGQVDEVFVGTQRGWVFLSQPCASRPGCGSAASSAKTRSGGGLPFCSDRPLVLRQALPDGIKRSVLRLAALPPLDRPPVCLRERAWPATKPPRLLRVIENLTEH